MYLYGKRTSCPGEYAFDTLLDNTGSGRVVVPPAVRIINASKYDSRRCDFEMRQTAMQFAKLTAV